MPCLPAVREPALGPTERRTRGAEPQIPGATEIRQDQHAQVKCRPVQPQPAGGAADPALQAEATHPGARSHRAHLEPLRRRRDRSLGMRLGHLPSTPGCRSGNRRYTQAPPGSPSTSAGRSPDRMRSRAGSVLPRTRWPRRCWSARSVSPMCPVRSTAPARRSCRSRSAPLPPPQACRETGRRRAAVPR